MKKCMMVFGMLLCSVWALAQGPEDERYQAEYQSLEGTLEPPPSSGPPNEAPPYSPVPDDGGSGERIPERDPMMRSTGDIVLDYQGLIQKIDEMRRHEEEVLRRLEDLSKNYEEGLKKIEELTEKMEKEFKDFKEEHEEAVKEMKSFDRSWTEPTEIKGEVRGAPSDRYTTN